MQAEAVAIATDLAEIVGGAVALNLLFGVPLPVGGIITAVVAFVLLGAQSRGHRPFERVITGLLLVIGLGFGYTLLGSGVDPAGVAGGMVLAGVVGRAEIREVFNAGKTGKAAGLLNMIPGLSGSGSFSAQAAGKQGATSFSSAGGLVNGSASYTLAEAYAKGQGQWSVKGGAVNLAGSVEAGATLVHAQASFHAGKGPYTLDANAAADIGVKAAASGSATFDPAKGIYAAKVHAEAFAGARATAEANVKLGNFGSVGARAEAWAGVGAAANVEVGVKNGR